MAQGKGLVADLQTLLKQVDADLTARSDDLSLAWSQQLREQYEAARVRQRTAMTWTDWRKDEISQAAVAWVLASVFVRFCEDNRLIDGVWIAGQGDRGRHAVDAETDFYRKDPSRNARDWLREGFAALADLRAGAGILDREHNLVWSAPLGADAARAILTFWREQNQDGTLRRDLRSADLDSRFLGDIYQDLSESAKKKYALLQTPVFVEEFILDKTLEPAVAEIGLEGLRLIDPTCGSGHFLLGAFARLLDHWRVQAPGLDPGEQVQRALDHVHGVDINPFAVAIARFRLTLAALKACGMTSLSDAPAFDYHLAVGDSLLAGNFGRQGRIDDEDEPYFEYATEDVGQHPGILDFGSYDVVVGNPPYITVKDKALNEAYRSHYPTCSGKYALSVPFMELFFRLAKRREGNQSAGFVGQITSNSFMKREFGKKVIEKLLSGADPVNPVDLTYVIDTSGAFIPGHGTPTVILIGRRERPSSGTVRAVLGVRGEPGQPDDASKGLVWTQIVENVDRPGFDGEYVSVVDADRGMLATHPWSLSGGGAAELTTRIEDSGTGTLDQVADSVGITCFTLEDDVYVRPRHAFRTSGVSRSWLREMVLGDGLRDWANSPDQPDAVFPYGDGFQPVIVDGNSELITCLWPYRTNLSNSKMFGGVTKVESGLRWSEYGRLTVSKLKTPLSIAFAFVSTHNHLGVGFTRFCGHRVKRLLPR